MKVYNPYDVQLQIVKRIIDDSYLMENGALDTFFVKDKEGKTIATVVPSLTPFNNHPVCFVIDESGAPRLFSVFFSEHFDALKLTDDPWVKVDLLSVLMERKDLFPFQPVIWSNNGCRLRYSSEGNFFTFGMARLIIGFVNLSSGSGHDFTYLDTRYTIGRFSPNLPWVSDDLLSRVERISEEDFLGLMISIIPVIDTRRKKHDAEANGIT